MAKPAAAPKAAHATPHTRWSRVFILGLAAAAAVAVVVLAFIWPSVTSSAKDFPIAMTGPSEQVEQVEQALTESGDTFAITVVDSRADIVDGIKDRTYDGGIDFSGDEPDVLTASASSPVTTAFMTRVQSNLQKQIDDQIIAGVNTKLGEIQQQTKDAIQAAAKAAAQAAAQAIATGQNPADAMPPQAGSDAENAAPTVPTVTVTLTDIVPLADTDPNGSGITAAAFPFTLGGLIGGILISLLVAGTRRRLVAISVYAIAAGVIVVAIMQPWFGVLQGPILLNMLAASLAFFSTGMFIVGTTALMGPAGIGVGAVLTMLIGNPISAATGPIQFLQEPWGSIGQWFVPGAAATLLRDLSYFPDANSAQSWIALGGWAALGLILSLAGRFRDREVVHRDGWDEEDLPSPEGAESTASTSSTGSHVAEQAAVGETTSHGTPAHRAAPSAPTD